MANHCHNTPGLPGETLSEFPGGASERLALFAEWTGTTPPACVLVDAGDGPTFSDEILDYCQANGLNLDWFWLGDERGLVMQAFNAARRAAA